MAKKKLKPVPKSERENQMLSPAQHATQPFLKLIDSANVDKNTKAILKAMKLQTECIIQAMFDSVAAAKENE